MTFSSKLAKMPSKQKNELTKPEIDTQDISSMIRHGGRKFLSKLKQKSIRSNNSWYRILSLDKRRFIDAVIQTVDKIRSSLLLKLLTALAEKLLHAIGGIRGLIGNLAYEMQNFGQPLAQRISIIATKWGNSLAANWANDEGFIRYLTVFDMNNLPIFRVSNKL
jgi:hypothetical protein